MKILLLNYEFPPLGGGAGKATYNLAKELARVGHDVDVLTSRIKGQASKEEGDKQAKHQQELSEFKKQSQEIAEKTAEERKSRILAAARMDIAKQVLAQKREILELFRIS